MELNKQTFDDVTDEIKFRLPDCNRVIFRRWQDKSNPTPGILAIENPRTGETNHAANVTRIEKTGLRWFTYHPFGPRIAGIILYKDMLPII